MMHKDLRSLRKEYAAHALTEAHTHANPFAQFGIWFDEALQAGIAEPNAMTLATVDEDSKPAARVVLLKELDQRGFVFFTNYLSNKGRQLAHNPQACLLFLWLELQRQVRINGFVERVSLEASDQYFASRPRESQIGALASPQSQAIPSRDFLLASFEKIKLAYEGKEIVRPAHWGGYRLIPEVMEFWQGRPGRMHDRLLYTKNTAHTEQQAGQHQEQPDGMRQAWHMKRLAP